MSSSNSLIPIATFSGSSTYASSFQQVLTRAVQIASLPGEDVQADINTLTSQQQAMSTLLSSFAQLQGAVQSVATAAAGNTNATVSDASILSATASTAAQPGTYTVTVDDIGSAPGAISQAGSPPVTDPTTGNISTSSTFTLNVNGNTTLISPTGGSLDDLANAINSSNAGVQATVVNLGGSSGADYRLALTSTTMGAFGVELNDSTGAPLTTQTAPGSDVEYKVNGGTTDIHSNTRQITLAPGLTVNLLSQDPSTPVTVTVAADQSKLSSALSNLATVYNSAVSALSGQVGQNAGPLEGQSIVFSLESMLSNIAEYGAGPANLPTLTALGLSVDQNGNMSFDSSAFSSLSSTDIQQFLGGTTSGGFLQAANDSLNSMTDPSTGAFETSVNSIQDQINIDQSELTDDTTRVTDLQNSLMTRLSAADAAIATLQSQVNFFTQLFATENANNNANTTGGGG